MVSSIPMILSLILSVSAVFAKGPVVVTSLKAVREIKRVQNQNENISLNLLELEVVFFYN